MIYMEETENRLKNSNNEHLVVEKDLIPISYHLAVNKILKPIGGDDNGKRAGFFKIHNNQLQVHIRVPKKGSKASWFWFSVLDATPEEKELNKKLNVNTEVE